MTNKKYMSFSQGHFHFSIPQESHVPMTDAGPDIAKHWTTTWRHPNLVDPKLPEMQPWRLTKLGTSMIQSHDLC